MIVFSNVVTLFFIKKISNFISQLGPDSTRASSSTAPPPAMSDDEFLQQVQHVRGTQPMNL